MAETDWWLCPNVPRCPHAAVFHDVEDWEDDRPRCTIDGCRCGARDEPACAGNE